MTNISNIAVSGIRAAGVRFAASAENIANANSRDYSPLQTEQISTAVGPVMRVTKTDKLRPEARQPENPPQPETAQPSAVDVPSEFADIIVSRYDFKAAVKLLQTEDELNGKLLDILA